MTSFRPLKQNCPVCNGARTDCRENTKSGLIHCRYDDIGTQSGWRFVGADSIGFNMWAVDDGLARDSSLWESQRQQRAAQRERRLAATDERLAQSLSVDERDRNIRKIHAQIGLSSRHRQNLRDRGLTPAQIDAGKYFSIAPEQEVTGINPRLAGVDLWGSKLLIGQSGFACPVWDVQGRIIGWQTRFDDATNGKYKWATSRFCKRPNGGTAHLPNGELPLGCYRPLDGVKVTSIGLAEGFLKPYITAQKRGQVVIGAAGGNFASSPQQFKAYLDTLAAELDTKTVVLYPDSGAVPNNAVMRHYEQAIQMITEWGYTAQIAWWGQLTKEQPDIDELTSFEQIAYLTPEEFFKLGARSDAERHSFAGLFGIAPRLKRWFDRKRRSPWGFGCKDEVEVEPSSKTPKILEYGQKERIEQWENAIRQGVRYILDTSLPGTGKSHDTGLLTPLRFGVKQIIYATNQHRNPTTPTLDKDWQDLEARHKGLHRDEFGRLRRVNGQKPYSVSPNCGRNETISALRSKNIPGADTSDLLCMTCPQLELCRMGKAYGYLKQRASTLTQPRLRAHPDSLPDPIYQSDDKEFISYSERGLVIDEATEIIKVHRSVEIKASDISQTITALLSKQPLAFDALRPLLTTLHQHVDGEIKQPNIYGWSDAKIRQALPQVGEIDLEAIREALTSDPTPLIDETKSEHGVSAADLPRQARKMVTAADNFTAQKITNELALNWLPDFLDVLLGNQIGLLRIQHGVLTMTLSDDRLAKIAAAAKFVILLDATATASDIARRLKVDVKEILVMRQAKEDTSNLEVIQVQMGQRLGIGSRRQDKEGNDTFLQKRINALIDQISVDNPGSKVAVADFKRHTKPGDGKRHHWVDTRGVNDLEDYDVLIDVGIMCRTLADLEAEFTILYGRPPKVGTERIKYPIQVNGNATSGEPYFEMDDSVDPEFRAFVRRSILADTHQTIGRLRAHRRPNKKLKVYILGDYPFDFPVTLVKAGEMTPAAATKLEQRLMVMKQAVEQIKAEGKKVTQSAVALVTGCSQQLVSRYWSLLQTLLDDSYSKSSKTSQPPPDPDEIEWNAQEYLPLLAEESPEEVLKGMLSTFEAYGQEVFKAIWDATGAAAQVKILKTLLLILPASVRSSLAYSAGVAA